MPTGDTVTCSLFFVILNCSGKASKIVYFSDQVTIHPEDVALYDKELLPGKVVMSGVWTLFQDNLPKYHQLSEKAVVEWQYLIRYGSIGGLALECLSQL